MNLYPKPKNIPGGNSGVSKTKKPYKYQGLSKSKDCDGSATLGIYSMHKEEHTQTKAELMFGDWMPKGMQKKERKKDREI